MTRHQLWKLAILSPQGAWWSIVRCLVGGFLSDWSMNIDSFGIPHWCRTQMRSYGFDKLIFRVLESEKGTDFCRFLHAVSKTHARNRHFFTYYEDHMSSSCFELCFHEWDLCPLLRETSFLRKFHKFGVMTWHQLWKLAILPPQGAWWSVVRCTY